MTDSIKSDNFGIDRSVLESVIASAGVGILICDTEGNVRLANDAAARALTTSASTVLTSRIFDLLPLPQGAEVRAAFRHLSKTACDDEAFHEITFEIEGQTLKCVTHPIFTTGEDAGLMVTLLQNVTAETQAARAQTEFTSVIAHELRTPLTALKGSIDLVLANAGGEIGDSVRSLLSISQASCNRLIRLLDDLLDVAQAETGSLKLRMHVVSVDGFVLRAVETLRAQAESRGIRLLVRTTGEIPAVVADQDRLEQVVVNIISNALKFSPEKSRVTVNVRRSQSVVQVSVSDEGPGIRETDRANIFRKFYRLPETGSTETGRGLGLAISKAIVEQHGGRITVRNRRSHGSTFTIELPIPGEDELPRKNKQ